MYLDDGVEINAQPAFDEAVARERGLDKALSPNLFYRTMNRGILEIRGPMIETTDMCCGRSESMHITTLDGTFGTFALMSTVYLYFLENSITLPQDKLAGEPCGAVFGIPFWAKDHHENHGLILLKTVPGSISSLFENHASFRGLYIPASEQSLCIALLIWVSGAYAERKGIAILDRSCWESRQPVAGEYFLL